MTVHRIDPVTGACERCGASKDDILDGWHAVCLVAPEKPAKQINDTTLDDYRRGVAKVWPVFKLIA